jgi:hypothetical protein
VALAFSLLYDDPLQELTPSRALTRMRDRVVSSIRTVMGDGDVGLMGMGDVGISIDETISLESYGPLEEGEWLFRDQAVVKESERKPFIAAGIRVEIPVTERLREISGRLKRSFDIPKGARVLYGTVESMMRVVKREDDRPSHAKVLIHGQDCDTRILPVNAMIHCPHLPMSCAKTVPGLRRAVVAGPFDAGRFHRLVNLPGVESVRLACTMAEAARSLSEDEHPHK